MSRMAFARKVDRTMAAVEDEAEKQGRELTPIEFATEVYTRIFAEGLPLFEYNLPDKVKAEVILMCVDRQTRFSEMTEIERLQLQYERWFGGVLTYNFMTIHTEEQLLTTLRACLASGKPYELPQKTRQLIDQGAKF